MRRKSESGAVIPLVAISLAVMMGFAGLTVDVGYLEYAQRQQQSAADAAAIAGAQQLLTSGCPNQTAAQTAGLADASAAGFTNGTNSTVTVSNPPPSGAYSANSCAVYAKVTAPHSTLFARFFRGSSISASAEATATIVNNNDGCIYILDPNKTFQLNGTNINAPNCGILANGNVQVNGGTIDVGSFGYLGGLQSNGANFTGATPGKMIQVPDPCPLIAACAAMTASPPSTSNCKAFQENGVNADVKPGCYSSFQLNGGSVTLEPGTYVFTGVVQDNGPPVTGNGVTLYASATAGPVQFNGSSVTLTPPTTGANAGLLFYQDPSNTSTVQFNGGSMNLSGVMYAPGALGQINGSAGNYLVLVYDNVQLNGGFTVDPGKPVSGQSYVRNIVLAQ